MSELEQRVKALEAKVKILEETLETLKNMGVSEQMEGYIKQKNKTLKMVSLLNSVSDEPAFDFADEYKNVSIVQTVKKTVDAQIVSAVSNAGVFSDDFPDDPRYFTYEVEPPTMHKKWDDKLGTVEVKKISDGGIKITGYNGFESERVVVPKEIDGVSVISIGERVFMNAPFHEVILPKTIKSIGSRAFSGCTNLKHIDLPIELTYIGKFCFVNSGLVEIALPDTLEIIPYHCFGGCNNLSKVKLGERTKTIEECAFFECDQLKELLLPETVTAIKSHSLSRTSIRLLIIPTNVKEVSNDMFGGPYGEKITCVFLGMGTECMDIREFNKVGLIYCLPGSAIQRFAREHKIPIKPLNEFRMEDYQ